MAPQRLAMLSLLGLALAVVASEPSLAELGAKRAPGRILLVSGDQPVATYAYADQETSRPYFANLHAPGGVRISRNFPPLEGLDATDHAALHPGLWMAFGDLSGADNWRNKAPVVHHRMLQSPVTTDEVLEFAVENRYLSPTDHAEVLCGERCRFGLRAVEEGYLLTWDSTFFGNREFWFGDQEEMGLGIRVATPLRVTQREPELPPPTGRLVDSEGRRNEAEIRGQTARWVDYSGTIDGVPAGVTILCHPENFRASRFHARNYGFMAANPFADAAFKQGAAVRTTVKPGESLRLRYGVLLHAGKELAPQAIAALYQSYVRSVAASRTTVD